MKIKIWTRFPLKKGEARLLKNPLRNMLAKGLEVKLTERYLTYEGDSRIRVYEELNDWIVPDLSGIAKRMKPIDYKPREAQ